MILSGLDYLGVCRSFQHLSNLPLIHLKNMFLDKSN
jgi:hypothetical protein